MTMAHYTDHAIGEFVRFLRSKDKFKNTMIVIMGDHEGLASDRRELRETEIGRKYISSDKFVPLIVLNAPISLRYENVMGQIDIYPTLLNLLSLDDYEWKGLGNSIIGGFSTGFAIDPQREAIGDVVGIDSCVLNHSCQAWDISDCIIKYDYFHGMLRFLTQPKR